MSSVSKLTKNNMRRFNEDFKEQMQTPSRYSKNSKNASISIGQKGTALSHLSAKKSGLREGRLSNTVLRHRTTLKNVQEIKEEMDDPEFIDKID